MWDRGKKMKQRNGHGVIDAPLHVLIQHVNQKIERMKVDKQRFDHMLPPKEAQDEMLKMLAKECDIDLGFCLLPGCGRPFVKAVPHAKFCNRKCKQEYDNKFRGSENAAGAAAGADV